MDWQILFFETPRGLRPVEEFLHSLDAPIVAKVARTVDLLERFGPHLSMPHSQKLAGSLYELRVRGKVDVRILYGFHKRRIYLLHAFRKKSQKIHPKEIGIAAKRFAEIQRTP